MRKKQLDLKKHLVKLYNIQIVSYFVDHPWFINLKQKFQKH